MRHTLNDTSLHLAGSTARFALACFCALALVLCSCASSDPASQSASGGDVSGAGASQGEELLSNAEDVSEKLPHFKKLVKILGKKKAAEFARKAATSKDLYWIAENIAVYDNESPEVREKLLRLAVDEAEAIPFVRDYAKRYPGEYDAESPCSIAEPDYPEVSVGNKNVPHFYQWDQRWGYTVYSSAAFGMSGCAPTALAMVYQGTMGRTDFSPYDAAVLAQEAGYMDEWQGTYTDYPFAIAEQLGMYSEVLPIGRYDIEHALSLGFAIVADVKTGYFSRTNGHFIVLTGLTEDGKLVINDPYSVENSMKTWDVDFIVGEATMLCGYANPQV